MSTYVFEGFHLDAQRRILSRADGEPVPLAPKVFDTLLYFVERPGQLLGKRELLEAIWPNVIVDDNNLSQSISALRRVLGETPGQHRFIVTEPGRGFRFVSSVHARSQAERSDELTKARERLTGRDALLGTSARPWIAVCLLAALAGGVAAWHLKPAEDSTDADSVPGAIRLGLDLGEDLRLSGGIGMESDNLLGLQRPSRPSFALSPDGRYLVYAATDGHTTHLYRRRLDLAQPMLIPDTESATRPFVSPDSRFIGFLVGGEIKTVPIDGGEIRTVATFEDDPNAGSLASWTEDDTILLSADGGIFEVPANGGELVQLVQVESYNRAFNHGFPQMLPGRRAILYNLNFGSGNASEWAIVAATLDGAAARILVEGGSHPFYLPTGHIVFARDGALWAVPFDVSELEVTGPPVVVVEDAMHGEGGLISYLNSGAAQFSITKTGILAYVPGGTYPLRTNSLVWVDRSGETEPLPLPPARYSGPRFSPDGTRLSYAEGRMGDSQLWLYDVGLETSIALTNSGTNAGPVWSPNGHRLAFWRSIAGQHHLWWTAAEAGRPAQPIGAALDGLPSSWSTKNVLAFVDPTTGVWTVAVDGESVPERFVEDGGYPEFSPDGNWIAYTDFEGERFEVYVRPFPQGAPVHRISSDGGWAPLWSRDGGELFYLSNGSENNVLRVMVVDVETEPAFSRSRPRVLFEGDFASTVPVRSYDVSPDSRRFVFPTGLNEVDPQPVTRISIVLNWFQELRTRVPVP